MGTTKTAGADFYAKVDTNRDLFGEAAGFVASYVNDATGTVTDIGNSFAEVIKTVAGTATTASADAVAGASVVSVADATGFSDGDAFEDAAGNIYYITEINGTDFSIKGKLVANITTGDAITQVGNTGVYRVLVNIATPGDYTIIVSNPSVNMQNIAFPVEIADVTIDTVDGKVDDILNELGISATERTYKGFV